ncbi:MAG: DnaA regulatory inactivator Hda [Betaproteobacteria bacterium]|nr:DnaA regulatory inactivator Hda [Betaproteobacteria bacterium]
MSQLLLDLAPPPAPTLDNFVPGGNAELLGVLRRMVSDGEPERFVYLWGEPGCGRSHLLQAMARAFREQGRSATWLSCAPETAFDATLAQQDAVAVDDVEGLGPEGQVGLFNLYNALREGGGRLLVSGPLPPGRLPLREDLVTRLTWGLVYQVRRLSDAEKAEALARHAAARGMRLPEEVVHYLLIHGRRDLPALIAMLDLLDRYSLETKRPVTLPLLRDAMQLPLGLPRRQP